MKDILIEMMFSSERWQDLINKANEKEINLSVVKRMCRPEVRVKLLQYILSNKYEISPPHIARIPKDVPGEFREVYVNEDEDRIVLTLINDCLSDLFKDMIHPNCKSYQKGIGTQEVVKTISQKIVKLNKPDGVCIGYKADLSKYFDTVKIEIIDGILDELERRLGFEKNEEPVINLLRRYYHNDLVFDVEGNLINHYGSLKQGCAVAAFLANVTLFDIDKELSDMDIIYYRYSDDIVMIGKDYEKAKTTLENMLVHYGLHLNPKKVEKLYSDKWFKFLGFNIRGNLITLSKNRVKKFQKEIENRTIKKKNITFNQAKRNVINYLYDGDLSWASSCLGIMNCEKDLQQMNIFIMDCLRAVQTKKKKIGGLGVELSHPDYTILRGCGKNVKANRLKTQKEIPNYFSMTCLSNNLKMSKTIYSACVRSMQ